MCVHCGRSFAWRKKWERDWEQVKYCSDACRRGVTPARGTSVSRDSVLSRHLRP
ncbi:DUF2256 domain-containing protein [bacterium]|nr:DUF2256 domain-containing protein [bacterium]